MARPQETDAMIDTTATSSNVMEDGSDTDYALAGQSETESSESDCESFNKIRKKGIKSKARFVYFSLLINEYIYIVFQLSNQISDNI